MLHLPDPPSWSLTPTGDVERQCALPTCGASIPYTDSRAGQRRFCRYPDHKQTYIDRRRRLQELVDQCERLLAEVGATTRDGRRVLSRRAQLLWLLDGYSNFDPR